MDEKECSTCGANLTTDDRYVEFSCPDCGDETIRRCSRCKRLSNTYTCESCGFEGP